MSERIELLMKTYPDKRLELKVVEIQLRNFAGISENEVIDSMMFTQPEGERVQTSGMSDKTASIALSYREKRDRINREWYEYLFHRYEELKEELEFFEKAIGQLSGFLPGLCTIWSSSMIPGKRSCRIIIFPEKPYQSTGKRRLPS